MLRIIALVSLVTLAFAQDCCTPDAFFTAVSLRGYQTSLFQNVSIDYSLQAIRSDEAGFANNNSIAGTAWIFGPNNVNYPNTLFWQDENGGCYTETYQWSSTKFCTNTAWQFVESITVIDQAANVWYSDTYDNAIVATPACNVLQSISQYSDLQNFMVATYYNGNTNPINPTVFKPCSPTNLGRPKANHFRMGFRG